MTDSIFPAGAEPILPILPLRNSVLFPATVVPVNVGRPRSVRLIEEACGRERPAIGVVTQHKAEVEDPTFDQVYHIGTIARVLKVIRLNSGQYSVVLQGVSRMRIEETLGRHPTMRARVHRYHELPTVDVEVEALAAHLRESARQLLHELPTASRESLHILDNVREPGALADLIESNLPVPNSSKQEVLETLDIRTRVRKVLDQVNRQNEVLRVKQEISSMVEEEMSSSQREYLLRQQVKAIRRELGETDVDEDEIENLRERIALGRLPSEPEAAAKRELRRMGSMNAASSEYQVARTYVEWLADLPWAKKTPDRLDVQHARQVLDEDHYGLEKPKRRIVEYIAVRKLRRNGRAPILCFVGPPGVGKTSLARSIARASGRAFVRVSLGGVSDEAEVRGHRRTYVGAFPGRVVSGLKKASANNPVMILDEIDKLGTDQRGDPASALLEVLDPEQNSQFTDHYLDVPFDLSNVMFIATANQKSTIPGPLLDRMEVIDLPGYTSREKRSIARDFLIPRQLSEHGLSPERLDFSDEAIDLLIDSYTHEAGVRKLEQQAAAVCRAVAVRLANGEDVSIMADAPFIESVLGAAKAKRQKTEGAPKAGVATGLAWTAAGGDLLFVEATRMPGTGKLHLTGNMGDVLKESAAAAFTFVRARAGDLGLAEDFVTHTDIHIHLPAGGVPKDGAAAGVPLFVALASALTQLKVRPDVAMSGEITLRGNVLKVGGIKEKCLAAHRAGVARILLPKRNAPDLEDVPEEVRDDLEICLVSSVDEVLGLVTHFDTTGAPAAAE
ncbi:MAG: endopeptidase La [Myxococcales bacterium]|nr:endopeptidase La [Deltaproteobacteria bacterium]NND29167.1 endopeptidase La [Myxococcales bacterium]NNK41964.1 endopeptidase La [Myxococcales bacterium]